MVHNDRSVLLHRQDQRVNTLITSSLRFSHFVRPALKRGFDIVVSTILLIALSPLFAVVALIVKLDSAGPVFFRQIRRGRDYQPFLMWKFRSMRTGIPDPHDRYETLSGDPRITRVGSLLRRSSLDELPQLFNVIAGSMSLVGPRPLVEWESSEAARTHSRRFLMRPGITGLSQLTLRNSADQIARLNKDLEYVDQWGLWLDLQLLARTPLVIVRPTRIYPDCPTCETGHDA